MMIIQNDIFRLKLHYFETEYQLFFGFCEIRELQNRKLQNHEFLGTPNENA